MTNVLLALAGGYGLVAALLLLILFSSSVPLVLRATATVMTAVLFFTTYWGIGELRGWPSDTRPPESFRLHWARIVEPNKLTGEKGGIYLWLEALDENNYPSGLPRAYKLPYSRELAEKVRSEKMQISDGAEVAGSISKAPPAGDTNDRLASEVSQSGRNNSHSQVGQRVYAPDFGQISFGAMPAPKTPKKTP